MVYFFSKYMQDLVGRWLANISTETKNQIFRIRND